MHIFFEQEAMELLNVCIGKFRGKREITFLTGIVGPLAIGAVVFHSEGYSDVAQNMISMYIV